MIDDYNESQWTNQSIDTIPIIDITPLLLEQHDENRFECIQSILYQSCLQYGFFYISNISNISNISYISYISNISNLSTINNSIQYI